MVPLAEERREGMREIKDDLKLVLKILNGNGRIGIVAKVDLMWRWGGIVFAAIAGGVIIQTIIAIKDSLLS